MAQLKESPQLDQVYFENVSFQIEGLDPVLNAVDIDIPMDQTVIVQSTDPSHAVHLLEILAGYKHPQKGQVKFLNSDGNKHDLNDERFSNLVSSYFDANRPHPNDTLEKIWSSATVDTSLIQLALEQFEVEKQKSSKFKELNFELQKLVLLVRSTLVAPQMLILEDPALGLSEASFLNFLDWMQFLQRRGHLRHLFMTNNVPWAARHFEHTSLFVDDGLVYVETDPVYKKVAYF